MSWRLRGRGQCIYRRPSQWDAGDIQADCLVDRSSTPATFSSPLRVKSYLCRHLFSRSPCCARTSSTTAYVSINQGVHTNIPTSFAIRVPARLHRKLNTAPTSRLISTEELKRRRLVLTQLHRESVSSAMFSSVGAPTSANTRKAAPIGSGSKFWRNRQRNTRPKNCILWTRTPCSIAIFVTPWSGTGARLTSALPATETKRHFLASERR